MSYSCSSCDAFICAKRGDIGVELTQVPNHDGSQALLFSSMACVVVERVKSKKLRDVWAAEKELGQAARAQ